jgi:hypothetical protein
MGKKTKFQTQMEQLYNVCSKIDAKFILTIYNEPYVITHLGERKEAVFIKNMAFTGILQDEFCNINGYDIEPDAIRRFQEVLHNKFFVNKNNRLEKAELYQRVAEKDGNIYIDLNNEKGQIIEVTKDGWEIVEDAPVLFERGNHMAELPTPKEGGNLDDLKDFVRLANPKDFPLIKAWLVNCFVQGNQQPCLSVNGEAGSGKSTFCGMLKMIVDPEQNETGQMISRNEDNTILTVSKRHCTFFDNASNVTAELSDFFCIVATGGIREVRKLYTTDEVVQQRFKNPVILNGINDMIFRGDLADRAVKVELEKNEKDGDYAKIMKRFKSKRAEFFGAILSMLVTYLQRREKFDERLMQSSTRMKQFGILGTILEPELDLKTGDFLKLYDENKDASAANVIEGHPMFEPIQRLLAENHGKWSGTPTQFYEALVDRTHKNLQNAISKRPGGELKRIKRELQKQGITFKTEVGRNRLIELSKEQEEPTEIERLKPRKGIVIL